MGKRLIRIPTHQLASSTSLLMGQTAHVVLKKGQTFFGDILEANAQNIQLLDKATYWYNRKSHTHTFSLEEIEEIILEKVTNW